MEKSLKRALHRACRDEVYAERR